MDDGTSCAWRDAGKGNGGSRRGVDLGCGRKGFLAAAAIAFAGILTVGACEMTRTSDGAIRIVFAPDMVITAWGLEEALEDVTDLISGCATGIPRTCSRDEWADLMQAHDRLVKAKAKLYSGG